MNTLAIVRNTVDIFKIDWELDFLKDEERKAYYEAFSAFDWNNNGKISTGALIFAMRRAGNLLIFLLLCYTSSNAQV